MNASRAAAERPEPSEETACAVCGRREYEVVSLVDRRGRPLRTVMCTGCGLVWTNPRPSIEDVNRYYATEYRLDYAHSRAPTRRKLLRGLLGAEERRRALGDLLRPGVRVLDVGCGAGEFVCLLRRHGVEASGIEPGEEYADFSRRVLGIPIQTARVDTAAVAPGSQDVITMFHVLEHASDPRSALTTVQGWLSPAGRLVVEVPNIDSDVQAPRHRFHYAHLYNFNAVTLGALGQAVGLRLVDALYSDDGGNVTVVFGTGAHGPRPAAFPQNVAGMRSLFARHTSLRHYLSATPYRRALVRLQRRWQEDRLLRRFRTVDALIEWVAPP
jgi:2-polyprenyl-3-methyl-5-hydroxy-6-metoxy-1,4-benzoquinol methylase